jgi:hypothetical protein
MAPGPCTSYGIKQYKNALQKHQNILFWLNQAMCWLYICMVYTVVLLQCLGGNITTRAPMKKNPKHSVLNVLFACFWMRPEDG